MRLLKQISALIFFVLATTSSPSRPCGVRVRGRHYGSSTQSQVNHSPQQEGDQIPKEFQPDADRDYSDTDFENGQIQSRSYQVGTREKDKQIVKSAAIRRRPSGHLRRRPGHSSTNSTGSRNEGEYGINYQGGNGDVQIHQHIHEYKFSSQNSHPLEDDACFFCGFCRRGCRNIDFQIRCC